MDRPELARQRVPLEAFEAEEAARPLDHVDRPKDAAQEREIVRPLLERQHLLLQPRQVLIALDEKFPDEIENLVVVHYLPKARPIDRPRTTAKIRDGRPAESQ